jgi:hypothetical protein
MMTGTLYNECLSINLATSLNMYDLVRVNNTQVLIHLSCLFT